MANRNISEAEVLQTALGPGRDCPDVEELESLASGATSQTGLAEHVKSCSYCQTELHLLQTFHAGAATKEERRTVELLQKRSKEILRQAAPAGKREPWWKALFTMPSMAQASLAMALVLVVAGTVLHFGTSTLPSSLNQTNGTGPEVLRSGSFAVISPSGDLREAPKQIQWEKVPNAVRYQVRLLEVDQNELWKTEATDDHIDLPASVRSRIVPAKTLFCEIVALDSSGGKVADTGLVRFRLLLKG